MKTRRLIRRPQTRIRVLPCLPCRGIRRRRPLPGVSGTPTGCRISVMRDTITAIGNTTLITIMPPWTGIWSCGRMTLCRPLPAKHEKRIWSKKKTQTRVYPPMLRQAITPRPKLQYPTFLSSNTRRTGGSCPAGRMA